MKTHRTNNSPLYLLAILAAGVAGFVIPAGLLWAAWWGLAHGHLWLAVVTLVSLSGFVTVLAATMRSSQISQQEEAARK